MTICVFSLCIFVLTYKAIIIPHFVECSMPWAFSAFSFSQVFGGTGGAEGGGGAKSHIGLLQWLALSGPDIRLVIVKPQLIAQEKAAFKAISLLSWVCVYDMSCTPSSFTSLSPPPCIEHTFAPPSLHEWLSRTPVR